MQRHSHWDHLRPRHVISPDTCTLLSPATSLPGCELVVDNEWRVRAAAFGLHSRMNKTGLMTLTLTLTQATAEDLTL